jgi:Tol biopolymer transport system component/DNA-binding winged helix-turn-helix (wHTH) protein
MATENPIFQFEDVSVDAANAQILKAGRPLALEPKAFRVLLYLLERRGRLVEKDELLSAVWPGTFVTENALTREIALLRKVLGDDSKAAKYIETVPKRGYRFIASVTVRQNGTPATTPAETATFLPPAAAPRFHRLWLLWTFLSVALAVAAVFWQISSTLFSPEPRARQVTSSEGLDIYPSFSPDGNEIAYSSDASGKFEIYLKQLTPGGRVVQLTSDGSQNIQPAWSPDGKQIAFHSQIKGGIWVMPALGGVARQLARFGSSPAWSPDGTRIAFQSDSPRDLSAMSAVSIGPSTLWVVDVQARAGHELTKDNVPPGAHNSPAWSPDGKYIAFTTGSVSEGTSLWRIASDGTDLEPINAAGGFYNPVYSRDGNSLYVGAIRGPTDFGIWQFPVFGSRVAPVGKKIFSSLPSFARDLAISADGRRLAFSDMMTVSNIYSLPMAGIEAAAAPVAVTNDTRFRKANPSISPDGKRILFDVFSSDQDGGIWLADADGTNPRLLTQNCLLARWVLTGKTFYCFSTVKPSDLECNSHGCGLIDVWNVDVDTGTRERVARLRQDAAFFSYTRDGKRLAFTSQKDGAPNLWMLAVGDQEPRQLTFDRELAGFPVWSPDGKSLAYEVRRGDDTYIFLTRPDATGSQPVQLTTAAGDSWPHSWSPDGARIAFAGRRDGVWNIWWISADGKHEKQLTSYHDLHHFVRYPDWSPSGNAIAYEYAENRSNIWMLELRR